MPKRVPPKPVEPKVLLLGIFHQAMGELVSSKELKEAVGPGWRDALQQLRDEGYVIEEAIGASNNRSFRISQEQPSGPKYLTEPAPVPQVEPINGADPLGDVLCTVNLKVSDIRRYLRAGGSDEATDELAAALATVQRRYGENVQ